MFKIIIFSGILLSTFLSYGQNINISGPSFPPSSPIACSNYNSGDVPNFFDSGGAAGNYQPNENIIFTICPDLPNGPKINVSMGVNAGFTWAVAQDDTLFIYDGTSTAAPLLGAFNSFTNPNGFSVSASFENNPSGCLTFHFVSNGSNQQSGWAGNISCGNPPQPFFPHIEAFINGSGPNVLNPVDTGYVDLCFGDSILFVSNPDFPYSFETNGFGYSQSNVSVDFAWTASNGEVGTNSNQFWFTPPSRDGFLITLLISDLFPQTIPIQCKVRVSQIPDFSSSGPFKDTLCVNESVNFLGGVNVSDTVGVAFPPGNFIIGGTFGGLLPLPDGSGVAYSTTINTGSFDPSATVTSGTDISTICVNIEHSYLGDLEMWLTCPSGQSVILFNSFTGAGPFPGGFGGGTTFLGDANDQGNGVPGIGFDYCFSETNATWGTMATELAAGNTIPVNSFAPPAGNSMNPNGVYLPEQSYDALIGCPLNGEWTLNIQDNLSQDDGFVFNWSLLFDASLFPENETYLNEVINHYWEDSPFTTATNDTMITVSINTPGNHSFTFVVEDDFGCIYDTTHIVFVKNPIVLNFPEKICFDTLVLSSNLGSSDGLWSVYNSPGTPIFQSPTDINPTIIFPDWGIYNLIYQDQTCPDGDTARIELIAPAYVEVGSDTMCIGDLFLLQAVQFPQNESYLWSTGATSPIIEITQGGAYTITVSNFCNTFSETAIIAETLCDYEVPNVFSPNGDGINDNFRLVFSEGMVKFNIVILNRWGNLVQEYDNPDFEWDGNDINGNSMSEGVYFYRAIGTLFGGKELEKQGFVQLIRK